MIVGKFRSPYNICMEAVTVAAAKVAAQQAVTVREVAGMAAGEMEVGPTEVAVGGSGEDGGGEGGGGDDGGERRGGERHDHDIDRAQGARLAADQRDARLYPGRDQPDGALAGADRRDAGVVSPGVGLRQQVGLGGAYVSRQLSGSLARSAAVALDRAGGCSQRPTAWTTPGVVSSGVPPKACRAAGWQVGKVGSPRVVQASDAEAVRHASARLGTGCGTRAAESKG